MENNSDNQLNYQLMHSVQMYWNTIAYTINEVKTNMLAENLINDEFNSQVSELITTAKECSTLFGKSILELEFKTHYYNSEKLFYHQLKDVITNQNFLENLQTLVTSENAMGTRYFVAFLYAIGLDHIIR